MSDVTTREMLEAQDLLDEVLSWVEEEIEELPAFYQEKAREFREEWAD